MHIKWKQFFYNTWNKNGVVNINQQITNATVKLLKAYKRIQFIKLTVHSAKAFVMLFVEL